MADRQFRKNYRNSSSKVIALSGIFLALAVLSLYAQSLAPAGKLSLYALSSLFVSVIVIEAGIYAGWLFYLASSLLAFILVPNKLSLIPYFAFFGLYGLIKHYTEKMPGSTAEYILKFIFFNACLALALILSKTVLLGRMEIKVSLWLVIPALEVVFAVYDYVYSIFIHVYINRLRKLLF
ncbi:MAG: hypothetical protein GXX01_01325 [Clostridiales bacterium]|nr:hypothetical protein [Clostridiales bacterium]